MTSVRTSQKSGTFGIRLTPEERCELERQAGSLPLGTYIKSRLLDADTAPVKRTRRPVADQAALAQVLGLIGQSDVGTRLRLLSDAVENGSLVVDDDTKLVIQSACAEVHAMHRLLMKALGFEVSS